MNIFTANQVNQVYVVNSFDKDTNKVTKDSAVGTLAVNELKNGNAFYFQHKGAGGLVRSDLICKENIMYAKYTSAADMARKLKVATLTLKDDVLEDGALKFSENYVLTIKFDQVISLSPENQYWKHAAVRGIKGMTASDFYKTLALSIAGNMAREAVKMVSVWLDDTEVTASTKAEDLTDTYTNVVVKEVEQDWLLGVKQQRPVSFFLQPAEIEIPDENLDYYDILWGDVAYSEGDTVGNGKLMADYEYFYMGERADQYRMKGWPNYIPTTYLVDPTKTYDTIAIHFAYTGANHAVQKSEKDITLIIPTDKNISSSLISKINSIAGVEIIKVSTD